MQQRRGYILIETIVAMALLSVSMIVIQQSLHQAILVRGRIMDFSTARLLLKEQTAAVEIQHEVPVTKKFGRFPPPYERFSWEWEMSKLSVPRPELPDWIVEDKRKSLKKMFKPYMGKLRVTIKWERGGEPFEITGHTLVKPEHLWLPEAEIEQMQQ